MHAAVGLYLLATSLTVQHVLGAPISPPEDKREAAPRIPDDPNTTVFWYENYGGEPIRREAEARPPPIVSYDDEVYGPDVVARDVKREAAPEPLPMKPKYDVYYAGYGDGGVGSGKREASPEPEPLRPVDVSEAFQACYASYTSQKAKRGEPVDEAELTKRCGKAKREATPRLEPLASIDVSEAFQACYASYTSQKAKRGEPVDEAELVKRCGKLKREAEPEPEPRMTEYQQCYSGYDGGVAKRCAKAKRAAEALRPDEPEYGDYNGEPGIVIGS